MGTLEDDLFYDRRGKHGGHYCKWFEVEHISKMAVTASKGEASSKNASIVSVLIHYAEHLWHILLTELPEGNHKVKTREVKGSDIVQIF